MIVFDSDDFGADHVISDMCQSHDCRDVLLAFHEANPAFKCTLFAIPYEMTRELLNWSKVNNDWVELAVHGISHSSNYECEKMSYEEFDRLLTEPSMKEMLDEYFVKGFRSPGWQTSDGVFRWLNENGWWISCQDYDLNRLPKGLPAFVNYDSAFAVHRGDKRSEPIPTSHHHCWNVGWNGVYEQFDHIMDLIKDKKEFKFVGEVINEIYPAL